MFHRLLFFLIAITTSYGEVNFQFFKVDNGSKIRLYNNDILLEGNQIILELYSDSDDLISVYYKNNNDPYRLLVEELLTKDSVSLYPQEGRALTLDDEEGILVFKVKDSIHEKLIKFIINPQVSQVVDSNNILDLLDLADIRKYVDQKKTISHNRGYKEANVIIPFLESATTIIKSKDKIGTGTIIDNGKYILTNYHVIEPDEDNVFIALKQHSSSNQNSNNFYQAKVVKIDMIRDLALLEVPPFVKDLGFKSFELASDNDVKKGIDIYSMGHPHGYYFTFEYGMLNNILKNYSWRTYSADSILQYSMNSNRGNSGGPIVNEDLELVGIGAFSNTDGNNLNFAISITDINKFLNTQHSTRTAKRTYEDYVEDIVEKGKYKNVRFAKVDRDKNGTPDAMLKDSNGDGKWDLIAYDTDEDGSYERITSF